MKVKKDRKYYQELFKQYPDVVNFPAFCKMLGGISEAAARKLIQNNHVEHFNITDRHVKYMIPKEYIIDYVLGEHYAEYKKQLKVQI